VAGEGQVQAMQFALLLKRQEFVAVEKIGGEMLFAEKQPVPACRALKNSLFEKSPERRDACARPNHDDVRGVVFREAEGARFLDIDRDVFGEQFGVVGKETGGKPFLGAAMSFVTHNGDAEMRLAGMGLEAGGD